MPRKKLHTNEIFISFVYVQHDYRSMSNSSISGYQFNSHYDCVNAGYAIAQKTFRNLKELKEWDIPDFEKEKIVVKFECKELKVNA